MVNIGCRQKKTFISNNMISLATLKDFLAILCIHLVLVSMASSQGSVSNVTKFNPGHYVAVGPHFDLSEIKHFEQSGIKGVNKRYFWRTLERNKGEYDFSTIKEDLDFCAKHNKQLVVFLCDRAFWKRGALPNYLKEHEWSADGGGFVPIRWNTEFLERFLSLGNMIAQHFDSHPNFEGIAIQETSLGIPDEVLSQYDYTPQKYQEALLHILEGFADAFSTSNVFWYQNGIQGSNELIREIADEITGRKNIIMGGPDVLPYRRWLRYTYKIYPDYKNEIKLFCSAQDDSYYHHKNDLKLSEREPIHEEGYLTMEDIFVFARDEMYVQYLFWNHYYEKLEEGSRSFDDAIEVVKKYPVFNE